MTTDKRSVATDALETLGTIIDDTQKRDAIHLAVEPVQSADDVLEPGQSIGLLPDGRASASATHLGIVDPFLKEPVLEGQRFWLVVFPRQITSLRHVWEHPAFSKSVDDNINPKTNSEKWLRNLAESVDIDYGHLLLGAEEWRDSKRKGWGGAFITGGAEMQGARVPDEFWAHYEIVTGKSVPENERGSFFSCSC